ncbi:MAG: hypothetical protein ABIJ59_10915 [Pseudomonadota bacterium]
MPIIKNDIRLIDGDILTAVDIIKEHLPNVGYKISCQKITQKYADIRATNLQQSVIKLYLKNTPQIVYFHLETKSDEQIQIETKCDLFKKFRIFYYIFLSLLLFGSNAFLITNIKSASPISQWDSHQSFGLVILLSLFCFVSACFFYSRSISTFPYENFMNQFYDALIDKGFSNKNDIHIGHSFPDMWKVLFLMGVFFLPILFCFGIDNIPREHTFLSFFLYGAFSVMGLLTILLILMNYQPILKTRMFFALAGFSFCMPIIFYFSPPIILSVTGDLGELYKNYLGNGYPQQIIQYGSLFYLISIIVIIILAIGTLINTLQLPIRIVMQLDKSSAMHPNSIFNKTFQSENTFFVFNFLLVLLWGVFWFVKILGLYFTFTIIEKSISGSNYFFNSNLAILFYDNIKASFLIFFHQKIDLSLISISHRIIMLIYSAPMIIFVFLILKKNLKSSLEEYSLAVNHSKNNKKIENQISKKTKKICDFASIRLPIIRVTDSKNINAETKYLGFPLFKNILVVSEGAWDELKDKDDEFDVLIAHEIWHIKKHTLPRRILCFFSDYSLFGNGFLALLQNSFQIEREADNFAIKWIVKKHQNKNMAIGLLKSLLERIEETNWKNTIFQASSSFNFAMFKENSCRSGILKLFNESSKIQRMKINLKLFFQIYFGKEIQSYFHPSISQRIVWTQEKYGTEEAN